MRYHALRDFCMKTVNIVSAMNLWQVQSDVFNPASLTQG